MRQIALITISWLVGAYATTAQQIEEARSLLNEPLYRPVFSGEEGERLQANLAEARFRYRQQPSNLERIIWLGRRLAYLGRYRDAVDVFSKGLHRHPDNARLLRHRGHRRITLRRFSDAINDLSKAAWTVEYVPDRVEEDGAPNRFNIPRSTTKFNIFYHLGLAYYLAGYFEEAAQTYLRCLEVSANDDLQVATRHWLYMTLRRLDRDQEAAGVLEAVRPEMQVLENDPYHRLLLMYKGRYQPTDLWASDNRDLLGATIGYGVGNWYFYNGRRDRAHQIFEQILDSSQWAAFGYIAAEVEVARR